MGPTMSGSNNTGISPFGKCPANYLKEMPEAHGRALTETDVLADFVNGRIDHLERENDRLLSFEKTVKEAEKMSNVDLQLKVNILRGKAVTLKYKLATFRDNVIIAASESNFEE